MQHVCVIVIFFLNGIKCGASWSKRAKERSLKATVCTKRKKLVKHASEGSKAACAWRRPASHAACVCTASVSSSPAHWFKYRNWAKVPADLNNATATMKTVHAALVPFHCWKRGSVEQREERRGREGRGKAWFLWTLSRPHSGLRCQELNRTRARHSSARRTPEPKTERPETRLTSLSLSMSASQLKTCSLLDNRTWLAALSEEKKTKPLVTVLLWSGIEVRWAEDTCPQLKGHGLDPGNGPFVSRRITTRRWFTPDRLA